MLSRTSSLQLSCIFDNHGNLLQKNHSDSTVGASTEPSKCGSLSLAVRLPDGVFSPSKISYRQTAPRQRVHVTSPYSFSEKKKTLLLSACLSPWCLWSWYPVNRPVLSKITGPLLGSLQFAYWANWSVDDTPNMEQPYILQHLHTPGTHYWSTLWTLVQFSIQSLQTPNIGTSRPFLGVLKLC